MQDNQQARKLVEADSGTGAQVSIWSGGAVAGVSIYVVSKPSPVSSHDRDNRYAVAVIDGDTRVLREKKAMRAVVELAPTDAPVLARAALAFLEGAPYGQPLADDSQLPANLKSRFSPPSIHDGLLEYWRLHGSPGRTLRRVRVDLRTLDVSSMGPGQIADQGLDPLAVARRDLATEHQGQLRRVLADLEGKCKDAAVAQLLLETVKSHPSDFAREEAARLLGDCHRPSMVGDLAGVLASDSLAAVREWAATILGRIGDPAARPALEKAASSDASRKVKRAAKRALGTLR